MLPWTITDVFARARFVDLFVIELILSGVTAFPLRWELKILDGFLGNGTVLESIWPSLASWISNVYQGLDETYTRYPFIAYGTDWLAFAHFAIAIAFIGPIKDPLRNIWVIEFGMIVAY
jgi:hypothetical protein